MTSDHARVSTGIGALDRAIAGGLPRGRVTVVTGDTGAGKTTLALQFLAEGVRAGETGIFIALDQKPSHVAESAAQFGWSVDAGAGPTIALLDGSPALSLMRQRARQVDARAVMADLVPHVRARGASRLVIDSLSALAPPEMSEAEEEDFFRDLIAALEDNIGCTTLCIGADGDPRASRLSAVASRLATGVIDLRLTEVQGRLHRHVLVRKMRGTSVDPVERAFEIGPAGLLMELR
ncbi:MAG: AAA family ATPase [Acidobacteriota bacterium]|nr:AAA family ATPase [Acidobacteriota bacterium]